jgi:O-antigen/teichoic acid export membrane protein
MASDKVAARARHQWKSAGMNIAGNLLLVPLLGAAGAAVATLLSESLLVMLYAMELQPMLGWPPLGFALLVAALGTAAFSALFAWLHPLPLAVMIPLAAGVYAGVALLFPGIRANEGRLALSFLGAARRPPSASE